MNSMIFDSRDEGSKADDPTHSPVATSSHRMSDNKRAAPEPVKLECPICYFSLGERGIVLCIITSCRPVVHYICTGCIAKHGKPECPICKDPLGDVVPLPANLFEGDDEALAAHSQATKRFRKEVRPAARQPAAVAPPPANNPHTAVAVPQFSRPMPVVVASQSRDVDVPPFMSQSDVERHIFSIALELVRPIIMRRERPPAFGDFVTLPQTFDPDSEWPYAVRAADYPGRFLSVPLMLDSQFPEYRFSLTGRPLERGRKGGRRVFFCLELHTSTVPQEVIDNLASFMRCIDAFRHQLAHWLRAIHCAKHICVFERNDRAPIGFE